MFSIILRVLTIAGTCTLAAMLTRKYLQKRAERETQAEKSLLPASRALDKTSEPGSQENELESRRKKRDDLLSQKQESSGAVAERARLREEMEAALPSEAARAEAASAREELLATRDKLRAERDELQARAEQSKLEAEKIRQKADERSEKVAKSKQAALAAQQAVKAFRKEADEAKKSGSTKDRVAEKEAAAGGIAPPPPDPSMERARLVLESSRQILENYKMPEGLIVDLSLARFSLDTADRLMSESRYDDAWEKAGAVGMIVGISEMRAAIEQQLKDLKKDPEKAEKVKLVRAALSEADMELAEASKSFVAEQSGNSGNSYTQHLQTAFQKTMQADGELKK